MEVLNILIRFSISVALYLFYFESVFYTLIAIYAFNYICKRIIVLFYGVTPMTGLDAVWYHDTEDNRANILGISVFEKRTFEEVLKTSYMPRGFMKIKKLN